jgi:TatA/E family protein of Tat protein translocase
MPFNLGLPEIIVLFLLGLVIFGPKKLPELGKSLGEAIRNFKSSFQKISENDLNDNSAKGIKQDSNHELNS